MSPRVAKKDKPEIPKPLIQAGSLGFHPLKPLSLSYLYRHHCDLILGHKDAEETRLAKAKPILQIKCRHRLDSFGSTVESFDLTGKVFNGFSDAFYRGKLPQVLISTVEAHELNLFLNEFLDYLDKMLSLGFFMHQPDQVDKVVPYIVLAGNGIFYRTFLAKLQRNMRSMEAMEDILIRQILCKFVRGAFDCYRSDKDVFSSEALDARRLMRIGSCTNQALTTVQTVFSLHGIVTSIDNTTDNSPERLELLNAWLRFRDGILPAMQRAGLLTETEKVQMALRELLWKAGMAIKAFDEMETVDMLFPAHSGEIKAGVDAAGCVIGDETFLPALGDAAQALQDPAATALCTTLSLKIAQLLKDGSEHAYS